MPDVTNGIAAGIHLVDEVLVVQAPDTFDDESLRALRRCVLEKTHALGARGVILDVSALRILDSVSYDLLADTARTLKMLGAKTVFSGFQPGVVAALIELDVDSRGIDAALDVAHGLALLRPEPDHGEEEPAPLEDMDGQDDGPAAPDDETEQGEPDGEPAADATGTMSDEEDDADDEERE